MDDKPYTILLIEDDLMHAQLTQEVLLQDSWTFKVEWVTTLQDGLARLTQGGIDAVLTDLGLPDSQGASTFSRLRAQVPNMPIVIVSAREDKELAILAVQEGAQDYLVKGEINYAWLGRTLHYAIERKKAQHALQESQARYIRAVRGAKDGLWDWNLETNEIYFSPRWKAMLGYEEDEITTNPDEWFSRVHDKDLQHLQRDIKAHFQGHTDHLENEHRVLHKGGTYHWMLCRGLVERGASGQARHIAGSQTDITRHKTIEQRLQHYAFYDPLTGLPNRILLTDRLGKALKRAERHQGYLLGILFLDLDGFKEINDTLGHMVGDQLLVSMADRLQTCVSAKDTVARFGGDEFVILLDNIEHADVAWNCASRIKSVMSLPFSLKGQQKFVSASIGITVNTRHYERPQELLHDADMAMYQAKANGKAGQALFETGSQDKDSTTGSQDDDSPTPHISAPFNTSDN